MMKPIMKMIHLFYTNITCDWLQNNMSIEVYFDVLLT